MTWITPEPFLGHFGIGGIKGAEPLLNAFFDKLNIRHIENADLVKVTPEALHLSDGTTLPFVFSMIMPPFLGQDVVRNSPGVGNAKGYVPVHDTTSTRRLRTSLLRALPSMFLLLLSRLWRSEFPKRGIQRMKRERRSEKTSRG
ncbi:MAG: hypothetical protein OWU32_11600 [Firmicutes bacterium]|nr:hypothetical protein [Bacillota bacterium]